MIKQASTDSSSHRKTIAAKSYRDLPSSNGKARESALSGNTAMADALEYKSQISFGFNKKSGQHGKEGSSTPSEGSVRTSNFKEAAINAISAL